MRPKDIETMNQRTAVARATPMTQQQEYARG